MRNERDLEDPVGEAEFDDSRTKIPLHGRPAMGEHEVEPRGDADDAGDREYKHIRSMADRAAMVFNSSWQRERNRLP